MIYTKYFAGVLNESGPFHFTSDQWKRVMNIVFIEGVIHGLNKVKEKEASQAYKYDMIIFKQQKTLTDLTGNLAPKELIREMHRISSY